MDWRSGGGGGGFGGGETISESPNESQKHASGSVTLIGEHCIDKL